MEDTKKWYLSKTVWKGVIGMIVTILVAGGVVPEANQEQVLMGTLAVISALDPIVRSVTKTRLIW